MHKYQFHISYNDKVNTAASKAVQDCRSILSEMGYRDCSIEDIALSDKLYRIKLIFRLIKFFFALQNNSLVAVQYPLLSGNAIFKYFIKMARYKRASFFCVIHDLDDLRYTGTTSEKRDVEALSYYDYVIAHTPAMTNWLKESGLERPVFTLKAFDYLSVIDEQVTAKPQINDAGKIAFAGNLSKSGFIYSLNHVKKWQFNLYGPNYEHQKGDEVQNIKWNGVLSPDEVLNAISGAFGLVWDGEHIDHLDAAYGNYLKYNYPHKLSLYLAAGLPVIAPKLSAIGSFIEEHGVGVLIDNLYQLDQIAVETHEYEEMRINTRKLGAALKSGAYLTAAVAEIEAQIMVTNAHLQTNQVIR